MAHSRKKNDISDAEYQKRKAELEKEKDQLIEDTRKLIAQGEDLESLQKKADGLKFEQGVFKRVTPKPAKKSFSAKLFGCLPCCGNSSEADDERKPLLKHRK